MIMRKFIEAKWHTVPLAGELKRINNGDKTVPHFEKGWKKKYKEEFNTKATAIGGAITGKVSNIIAIDCDNEATFLLFRQLDPDYDAVFHSKGKGKGQTGTIIYQYNEELQAFDINDGVLALDFYTDNGFVYLPTDANETKVPWTDLHTIKEAPATVKLLLTQLEKKTPKYEEYVQPIQHRPCLAPLLQQFIGKRGEFIPSLFKIITPREFRTEEQYQKVGYLHPKNIPSGRGSEYLSKLSAILGADTSVDQELYMDCMIRINNLFTNPMDDNRLEKTIIDPMLEGKSSIDGKQIWAYDEHWSDQRFTVTTKHGLIVDLGFDDERMMYYYLDMTNEEFKAFNKDTEFVSFLDVTVTTVMPKKAILKKKIPIVRIISDPAQDFGFCNISVPQVLGFNSFKPSPELRVLHHPQDYAQFYKRPNTTIKYLETLVPNKQARDYLLQFIKRKLTYFEYSPVILYFLGVSGSGKDTFTLILSAIMGTMSRPTTEEFLDKYNTFLLDTYFCQLDEYGDQLTRLADRESVKGKLKAWTGSKSLDIRDMRTASYSIKQMITIIMTANKNPIILDDNDRRVHLMETPNILELQPWWSAEQYDQIFKEIKDFCYYLATEVPMMSKDEYISPPKSDDKHKLIADSMFAAQRIAYALKHHMHDYLINLAKDHGVEEFAKGIKQKRFTSQSLEQLYDELTDFKGDVKTVRKILRKEGFHAKDTTTDGMKSYYYSLDDNPFGD